MPYDANGNFTLATGYQAVTGQTILASQHNPPLEDIGAGLSQVLVRSGVAPMGGNLDMGGFKVTGMGTGTASDDAVTKAQLDAIIAALTPAPSEVAFFARLTAPAGWIKANGGTIGNADSGATNRANADTINLFTVLWTDFSNTVLPIQTSTGAASTRGISAAADYAANKRLTIPDVRGEFLRAWDDARGVDTSRAIGTAQDDALESHVHTGVAVAVGNHSHTEPVVIGPGNSVGSNGTPVSASSSANFSYQSGEAGGHGHVLSINPTGGTETRPRNIAFLCCIKL